MANCFHDFNVPHVLIIFQTSAALIRTFKVRRYIRLNLVRWNFPSACAQRLIMLISHRKISALALPSPPTASIHFPH